MPVLAGRLVSELPKNVSPGLLVYQPNVWNISFLDKPLHIFGLSGITCQDPNFRDFFSVFLAKI